MKRTFLGMTMLAAMFFHASAALAGGLNLAWDHCTRDGGLQARVSDCLTNTGRNTLVGSFVPLADITIVTSVEYVLDVLIGDGVSPIPPWWELVGIGACRDFGVGPLATLTANAVAPVSALACPDWASGNASGGLAAYYELAGTISPVNQPAHRRVVIGFAVPLANAVDLVSTQEYARAGRGAKLAKAAPKAGKLLDAKLAAELFGIELAGAMARKPKRVVGAKRR